VGYATPGYKNSQFLEDGVAVEEITIPNQTFSPDNDGFEDVLPILFKFSEPNYAANVTIYNDQGVLIRKLVRNETIGSQGQWIWDGLTDTNQKARTGIYIIYAELFDLNGNVKKYKKTAVLAGNLN
jgi:flagellar hook assembly protein FlgD